MWRESAFVIGVTLAAQRGPQLTTRPQLCIEVASRRRRGEAGVIELFQLGLSIEADLYHVHTAKIRFERVRVND